MAVLNNQWVTIMIVEVYRGFNTTIIVDFQSLGVFPSFSQEVIDLVEAVESKGIFLHSDPLEAIA